MAAKKTKDPVTMTVAKTVLSLRHKDTLNFLGVLIFGNTCSSNTVNISRQSREL
ncbi:MULTISPECIES: hypothetical protein [unclassified Acidithiobacillus]|uniref:hypothetical protein n=1 Tax=unclassified Acidithiobacillus TaxID=2614800 RepID=UPI001D0D6AB5|nr:MULTISPECIES: hypothetical protein [unclassified Acidithiobacillus]